MKYNFSYGDTVMVLHTSKYNNVILAGEVGTVKQAYQSNIAVELYNYKNSNSSKGYFYFKESDLKLYDKGDDKFMEGNYSIAHVRFLEGTNTEKLYRYALYDNDVGVGDIVVVKSAHHGFGIAQIANIEPKNNEPVTREVICKADFSAYYAREAARKRRAELGTMMRERAAKLQETVLYKMLAKEDTEMQQLISEYETLEGLLNER